jgi:hypothetical protein
VSPALPTSADRRRATSWCLVGFVAFFLLSWVWSASRTLFPSNLPPLFVRWHPLVGPMIVVPTGLAAALWFLLPRLIALPKVSFLVILVLFTWLFAETLAMQAGQARRFQDCCTIRGYSVALTAVLERRDDYFFDVATIQRIGPRTFAGVYPRIVRSDVQELSLHSGTHPPGAALFEWALWRGTGRSLLAVAVLLAFIGALAVLPAYAIAQELYGEPAARSAAVLLACTPGVVLFSATSADAIFMTVTGVAVAALVRAPRSDAWAFAAGVLAVGALVFTWGALALGPIGIGVALLALRDHARREVIRRAGIAVGGLGVGWLVLRLTTGVNLVADLWPAVHRQVTFVTYSRSYPYWLLGNIVAFLFVAGVVNTGSLVAATAASWRERRLGMETVLWVTLALTSISSVFKGETDHNWLFFMPLAIAVASSAVPPESLRPSVGGGLGQAVLTEALFYTGW